MLGGATTAAERGEIVRTQGLFSVLGAVSRERRVVGSAARERYGGSGYGVAADGGVAGGGSE